MSRKFIKTKRIVTLGLTALMLMGSSSSFWDLPEGELNEIALNPLSITVYAADLTNQFKDEIPQWASSDISYLVDKGIMKGYEDSTFRANNTMTKMEFIKAVVCSLKTDAEIESLIAEGKKIKYDEGTPYTDWDFYCDNFNENLKDFNIKADNFWGTPYLFVAHQLGLYDHILMAISDQGQVGFTKPITREEACQIMYLACTKVRGESLPEMKGIQNIINTPEGINVWYDTAVKNCVSNGLIAGIDQNYTIAPKKTLTRAEACCILARITDTSRRLAKPVVPEDKQQWVKQTSFDDKVITKKNPVTGESKTMSNGDWTRFKNNNYPTYDGTKDGEYSKDGWWKWMTSGGCWVIVE